MQVYKKTHSLPGSRSSHWKIENFQELQLKVYCFCLKFCTCVLLMYAYKSVCWNQEVNLMAGYWPLLNTHRIMMCTLNAENVARVAQNVTQHSLETFNTMQGFFKKNVRSYRTFTERLVKENTLIYSCSRIYVWCNFQQIRLFC